MVILIQKKINPMRLSPQRIRTMVNTFFSCCVSCQGMSEIIYSLPESARISLQDAAAVDPRPRDYVVPRDARYRMQDA